MELAISIHLYFVTLHDLSIYSFVKHDLKGVLTCIGVTKCTPATDRDRHYSLSLISIADRDRLHNNDPSQTMAETLAILPPPPLSQTVTDIAMETAETVSDIPAKPKSTAELV